MQSRSGIGLEEVQAVYSGPECDLWELIMGQQIHIGGMNSSGRLADAADIGARMSGVDLCCCTGAGMRFLLQFRQVERMHGVDATASVVERGRLRCQQEKLDERITFTVADACQTGLPDAMADFAWGEDAWCYVVDKAALIAEAARLVKPGGTIAFTDWIEGPAGLNGDEAARFLKFMKFPDIQDLHGYGELLAANGCNVSVCEDTGQFAPYMDLYLNMLEMQLTSDALRIIGYDTEMFAAMAEEMKFMQHLAHAGKIAQGRFVARKAG